MIKYKLEDISLVVGGGTPPTTNERNYDGDIVWITPKDLSDQNEKFIERGQRSITLEGFNACSAQMIPPYNILMSSRAPIGLLAINRYECCTNQGFKSLILNKDICDVDYVYYYLKHHIREIESLGSGTTFKEVSKKALQSFEFSLPELEVQLKISKLLSDIDAKITLNRSINHNLEAMAKQLYDYWFVQFDFPDENGMPYKSSGGKMVWNEKLKREIPEGWNLIFAKDVCPIITGKEDANFSTVYGQYPFFTCAKENLNCDTYAFDGSSILIAGNGDFNVKHYTGKFNAYQRTYVLIPKLEYYACLFFAASSKIRQFKDNSNGSIVKFITKGDIEDIELLESKNSHLYSTLNSLLFSIEQNNQEVVELTKLRDSLLPLLMNGQVSINYDLESIISQLHDAKKAYFTNHRGRQVTKFVYICAEENSTRGKGGGLWAKSCRLLSQNSAVFRHSGGVFARGRPPHVGVPSGARPLARHALADSAAARHSPAA